MRAIDSERLLGHPGGRLVGNRDRPGLHRAFLGTEGVDQGIALLGGGEDELVDVVHAARGVHPAGLLVEALVDEELAPGERAVGVQPLLAGDLRFLAEEERRVRVDEEQRLAVDGVGRRDGEAVRPGRLGRHRGVSRIGLDAGQRCRVLAVERLEARNRHALDVAADAALAEAERHPWLEPGDHPRLHVRMRGQVIVQAVGPAGHQRLEPGRRLVVLRFQVHRVDEQLHPQVAVDLLLPFGLGQPPHRVDEVGLDAVEVVLGLGVHQPEDGVGVGLGRDVRDAPVVADDGHALGAGLPGGDFGGDGRGGRFALAGEAGGGDEESQERLGFMSDSGMTRPRPDDAANGWIVAQGGDRGPGTGDRARRPCTSSPVSSDLATP